MRLDRGKIAYQLAKQDLRKGELAERAGLSRNTIASVCSGKRCSEETAQKIAAALGVTVGELVEVVE